MTTNSQEPNSPNQEILLITAESTPQRGKLGHVVGALTLITAGGLMSVRMADTANSLDPYPKNNNSTTSIETTTSIAEVTTSTVEAGLPPVPPTTTIVEVGLPPVPSTTLEHDIIQPVFPNTTETLPAGL